MRRNIRTIARWYLIAWMCAIPARGLAQDSLGAASRGGGDREPLELGLPEALDRALTASEEVRAAIARVAQAGARLRIARSRRLPLVNALLSYTRQIRSPFDIEGAGLAGGDTTAFEPDTTLPLEERVRRLEQALARGAPIAGFDDLFDQVPFGQENTWIAALDAEWLAWSGGRVGAEVEAAERSLDAARDDLEQEQSTVAAEVKEAYFDALLAQQRVAIARATLAQAEEEVALARERFAAGAVSRLELLRAEVERDNLVPPVDDALDALDRALLALKEVAEVPPTRDIALTTALCPPGEAAPVLPSPATAAATISDRRAAVRAARAEVDRLSAEVRAERADYLPSVTVTGRLGEQAFPEMVLPGLDDWRDDWSVGVRVDWPVFTGFRREAEVALARARVAEATAELGRVREIALSDYILAYRQLARAGAEITTRRGTISRARRVYELTRLRYAEGLGIQLEVTEARVALEQARTNLAEALRDYYVALARAEFALGRPVADTVIPAAVCPDAAGPIDP